MKKPITLTLRVGKQRYALFNLNLQAGSPEEARHAYQAINEVINPDRVEFRDAPCAYRQICDFEERDVRLNSRQTSPARVALINIHSRLAHLEVPTDQYFDNDRRMWIFLEQVRRAFGARHVACKRKGLVYLVMVYLDYLPDSDSSVDG